MIEVDVFWSFSIGASLAASAWRQLGSKEVTDPYQNKYFIYTVLFLSLVFAPSGSYLLWRFPGWETMFFLDRDLLQQHPMLPTMFAMTNVLLGVWGFRWAYSLIKSGRPLSAHTLWTSSYVCMFAILGLGYARFLYAGTSDDWKAGRVFPLTAWFSSEVFFTLLVMGIPMLPGLWGPMWYWAGGCTATEKAETVRQLFVSTFRALFAGAVLYTGWIEFVADPQWRSYLSDGPFRYYAPLVGYFVANFAFMLVAYWPLVLLPIATKQRVS